MYALSHLAQLISARNHTVLQHPDPSIEDIRQDLGKIEQLRSSLRPNIRARKDCQCM
jgi:hypothetical protein